jgi:hypothetical protein
MANDPQEPLFDPDPHFAAQWYIEDPVAQGALKHASVTILDSLREAADELGLARPDLGDFGPLAIFPAGWRPALTPLLVDKLTTAAVVMGWKLAQPGPPIRPVCLAEELALELIRREAVLALEITDAGEGSIGATRGLFEVCEDDDVLDLFSMQEPADAALARENPVNRQMGKADMRIEHWFDPFYGGKEGALHPLYLEAEQAPAAPPRAEVPLTEVAPGVPLELDIRKSGSEFRVIIRLWEDAFLDRHPADQMPSTWIYELKASSADAALEQARERFPEGATQELDFEQAPATRLDREDLSRVSIVVHRVGLPQEFLDGRSFYVIARLSGVVADDGARNLSATLIDAFPKALVMSDGEKVYCGISLNAESYEEAEANVEDFFSAFADAAGLAEVAMDGSTVGQGERNHHKLIEEIEAYRREE